MVNEGPESNLLAPLVDVLVSKQLRSEKLPVAAVELTESDLVALMSFDSNVYSYLIGQLKHDCPRVICCGHTNGQLFDYATIRLSDYFLLLRQVWCAD